MNALQIAGQFLFVLVLLAGLGMIPFGLPGTVVILLDGLVYGWVTGFKTITGWLIAGLLLLCVVAELGDNLLGIYGARKYGTTSKGTFASVIGSIIGGMLGGSLGGWFGLVGLIVAPLVGAFTGAGLAVYWMERRQGRSKDEAKLAVKGALVGRMAGIALRFAAAIVMTALLVRAVFFG